MKYFVISILLSASIASAAHSPSPPLDWGIDREGIEYNIDSRCAIHYRDGWFAMGLSNQIYYTLFCMPRGWA